MISAFPDAVRMKAAGCRMNQAGTSACKGAGKVLHYDSD
jgi:hypothetical protein